MDQYKNIVLKIVFFCVGLICSLFVSELLTRTAYYAKTYAIGQTQEITDIRARRTGTEKGMGRGTLSDKDWNILLNWFFKRNIVEGCFYAISVLLLMLLFFITRTHAYRAFFIGMILIPFCLMVGRFADPYGHGVFDEPSILLLTGIIITLFGILPLLLLIFFGIYILRKYLLSKE